MNQQDPGNGEEPTRPAHPPDDAGFPGAQGGQQFPPAFGGPPSQGPPPAGAPHQHPPQQGQQPPYAPPPQQGQQPAYDPPLQQSQHKRPGLALGFAAGGSLALLVSLFLPWFEVELWVTYVGDTEGPLGGEKRLANPFTAVGAVKDVTGPDPRGPDPGILAHVLMPWLAIVLVLLCCALAFAAAVGLGDRRRAKLARIATGAALVVTAVLVVLACYDLGVTNTPPSLSGEATGVIPGSGGVEVSSIRGYVDPYGTIAVAAGGAVLLAIAALIGPRYPRPQPAATQAWFPGASAPQMMPGPDGMPQQPQPGQQPPHGSMPPHPGAIPGMPGAPGAPGMPLVTQLSALILTGVAAVLCFAGYVFLPWGKDVSFNDMSDAAREFGLDGKPVTEAYFAWLAWFLLLMTLAVAVLVAVGKRPGVVNASRLRPYLAGACVFALLVHLWVMIDLNGEGADLSVGTYAVALGFLLAIVGGALPLRPPAPAGFWPPHGYPPQPPPPPMSPGPR